MQPIIQITQKPTPSIHHLSHRDIPRDLSQSKLKLQRDVSAAAHPISKRTVKRRHGARDVEEASGQVGVLPGRPEAVGVCVVEVEEGVFFFFFVGLFC